MQVFLLYANARINNRIGKIRHGIKDDDRSSSKNDSTLDDRIVALGNGRQRDRADTRNIKKLLGNENPIFVNTSPRYNCTQHSTICYNCSSFYRITSTFVNIPGTRAERETDSGYSPGKHSYR